MVRGTTKIEEKMVVRLWIGGWVDRTDGLINACTLVKKVVVDCMQKFINNK